MAVSHTLGLYIPFKINRPITEDEKKSRFFQGKRTKKIANALCLI
jgi:hypothetical protein